MDRKDSTPFTPPPLDPNDERIRGDLLRKAHEMRPTSGVVQQKALAVQEALQMVEAGASEPVKELDKEKGADKKDDSDEDESSNDYYMVYTGTPTDNPVVRKEIERRCKPIDFGMLLTDGTIEQEVPIVPDKLVVVYRTIPGDDKHVMDDLWAIETESKSRVVQGNVFMFYGLALSVVSINGKPLPAIKKNENGDGITKESLHERAKVIRRLPEDIINILAVNQRWFRDRVGHSTRVGGQLKNG